MLTRALPPATRSASTRTTFPVLGLLRFSWTATKSRNGSTLSPRSCKTGMNHCLSKPENAHYLKAVRDDVYAFVHDMDKATVEQHRIAKKVDKHVVCQSNDLLHAKHAGLLGFGRYTAAIICLIARYGIRGGKFSECQEVSGWHLAATMLLVSVIVDLEHGYHFAPLFKKNAKTMADEQARKSAEANSDFMALAQQLHELTMQSDQGFKPEDEQMEALRLGLSSIELSQ